METLNRALIALLLLYVGIKETRGVPIGTCVVSDFAASEILYSFETDPSITSGFNAQTQSPELRMGDGNGNFFSPLYEIHDSSNGGVLNYNKRCWHKLKACEAHVGMLAQAENRQHLFGLSSERSDDNQNNRGVRLQIREQGGDNNDWVDCVVVGRTLDFADDDDSTDTRILYEKDNTDFEISYGLENNFEEAQLGLSGYQPAQIRVFEDTNGNNLIGIQVLNSNGAIVQSFGVTSGTSASWPINSPIEGITLYYTDSLSTTSTNTLDGYVCGIKVDFQSSSEDSGCDTAINNVLNFDVQTGETFAGFIGFVDSTGSSQLFLIQPLVYKTVDSMVYYYGRTHESVTMHVNLFTSGSYTYKYTSWDEIDTTNRGVGDYGSTDEAEVTFSTGGENTVEIPVSCGCIRVAFVMPDDSTFYAWSFGFMEKPEIATSGTSSGTKYMTASHYEVDSDIDNCPDMRLMKYYTTAIGGVLYLDGLLGVATSSSITNVVDEANFVDISGVYNKVDVYYSSNGKVDGLKLSWGGSSVASIGSTSGTATQSLTPDGVNEILIALEIMDNQISSGNQIVKAKFSEPTPPCLFSGQTVLDINGAWIKGGSNAVVDIDDDADADQYQYWFHMPVSYTTIHVDLSGYFLSQQCEEGCDPETYKLTLDSTNFGKGTIATGKFYHLQAEHSYYFKAKGEVDDYSSTAGADLESVYDPVNAVDTTNSFTTPDGVRYYCDAQGETDVQVEYESLPDIEIKLAQTPNWATLDSSEVTGVSFTAVSSFSSISQEVQFPNTEFFHFPVFGPDNPHCYPKFPEFTGYPVKVFAYWSSAQCIGGLGLAYKDRNGNTPTDYTYWLAGDETGYSSALTSNKEELDLNDRIISTVKGSTGTITVTVTSVTESYECLRTIEFLDKTGVAISDSDTASCIGPLAGTNADCFQTLFTTADFSRNQDEFYVYAFSGSITNDGNDYIVRLSAHYAYVDLPEVRSGAQTCELTRDIDWNYIRNTVWYREVELDNDVSSCINDQYVYAYGRNDDENVDDQWDPDRHAGTTEGDHEVVYHQALTRQRDHNTDVVGALEATDSTGQLSITRHNAWEINLFCYYNATKNVHSEFRVEAEPEWHADGTNEFEFSLRMYKECNYANEYDDGATPIMLVNEPVYMAVTLDNAGTVADTLDDYQVVGFACWASKEGASTTNPTSDGYYLLAGSDGCYADSTFRWNDSATTSKKEAMYFDAFAFLDGQGSTTYQAVQVSCRVRACLVTDDTDETAVNGDCYRARRNAACPIDPNDRASFDPFVTEQEERRSRRNAKGQVIEKIQTISSKTAFIVKKRDVENAVHIERGDSVHTLDQGGVRMAAGMFSLFVTTMFFCLMVISYKVYRLRNNYKKLKEDRIASYQEQ